MTYQRGTLVRLKLSRQVPPKLDGRLYFILDTGNLYFESVYSMQVPPKLDGRLYFILDNGNLYFESVYSMQVPPMFDGDSRKGVIVGKADAVYSKVKV